MYSNNRKKVKKVSVKTAIYDKIITTINPILEDNIKPSSLRNPQFEMYAKQYADNLLLKTFHCPDEQYKTPEYLLGNAFSAGFFCQMLNTLSDKEEFEKTAFIISVLTGSVYSLEGRLVGLLLNSDGESIKEHYENIKGLVETECRQFLTYQNLDEAPLKDLWTVYYTAFLIGAAINIDYKIA